MGFLDKAVKAAAQAKNQIDDVREARAQNAVQPVQHGPLPDHERQVLERAQALGALNPFALLTSAEASAAVGQQLGDAALSYGDDTIGVMYEARGRGNDHWRVSVDVYHATEPGIPFEAEQFLREMVLDNAVDDDRVTVEGVGHQAYLVSDYLWVLYGPILFYVNGITPQGPLPVDACAQVARQVVARLEQLDQG
jgi:hypothetical protein